MQTTYSKTKVVLSELVSSTLMVSCVDVPTVGASTEELRDVSQRQHRLGVGRSE